MKKIIILAAMLMLFTGCKEQDNSSQVSETTTAPTSTASEASSASETDVSSGTADSTTAASDDPDEPDVHENQTTGASSAQENTAAPDNTDAPITPELPNIELPAITEIPMPEPSPTEKSTVGANTETTVPATEKSTEDSGKIELPFIPAG